MLAILLLGIQLGGCEADPSERWVTWPLPMPAPSPGNIKIALFMGDMPPLSGQHHVYMIGAFAGFTNAASGLPLNDWDGGTAADRYEPAKMTFLSNLWFKGYVIELTPPVSNYASPLYMYFVNNKGTIEFAHGGDIGEIWENVGNQLSGTDSNLITWAAGAMTGCNNASYPGLEYLLCYEGSTLVVDLASAGGWQVDQPEGTFVEVTLTINWTGVPASHTQGALWADLADGNAVLTGSEPWMHADGTSIWSPTNGKAVTVTPPTATITTTVPIGSPCAFEFKLANVAGWDNGEEAANQAGFLNPDLPVQTINVTFFE